MIDIKNKVVRFLQSEHGFLVLCLLVYIYASVIIVGWRGFAGYPLMDVGRKESHAPTVPKINSLRLIPSIEHLYAKDNKTFKIYSLYKTEGDTLKYTNKNQTKDIYIINNK